MPKLKNPRHELLAQARAKGLTLEVCAVEAGYAGHPQSAHRALKNVNVSARVDELIDGAVKTTEKSLEDAMHELEKIAFSSLGKYFRSGPDALPELCFDTVSAEDTDALQDLVVEEVSGSTGARGKRVRIKLHDKTKALVELIKLKMAMEERELARQAPEAKTNDGSLQVSTDDTDFQDYLADLGQRYKLKSLDYRLKKRSD